MRFIVRFMCSARQAGSEVDFLGADGWESAGKRCLLSASSNLLGLAHAELSLGEPLLEVLGLAAELGLLLHLLLQIPLQSLDVLLPLVHQIVVHQHVLLQLDFAAQDRLFQHWDLPLRLVPAPLRGCLCSFCPLLQRKLVLCFASKSPFERAQVISQARLLLVRNFLCQVFDGEQCLVVLRVEVVLRVSTLHPYSIGLHCCSEVVLQVCNLFLQRYNLFLDLLIMSCPFLASCNLDPLVELECLELAFHRQLFIENSLFGNCSFQFLNQPLVFEQLVLGADLRHVTGQTIVIFFDQIHTRRERERYSFCGLSHYCCPCSLLSQHARHPQDGRNKRHGVGVCSRASCSTLVRNLLLHRALTQPFGSISTFLYN